MLACIALGPVGAAAATGAVQMPEGEFAGEYWDLIARSDAGKWLIAQAAITNLGPGDHAATVLGYVVERDGTARRFKRTDPAGRWVLDGGGSRIDLRSIAFDPAGPARSFEVAKDDLGVDLRIAGRAAPLAASRTGACSFELLDAGAPASLRLRDGADAASRPSAARVALTHRWATTLEADCVLRRVEVFVLEPEVGLYFAETTDPDGRVVRQLVAEHGGRVLFAGDPDDAAVRWDAAADGFAPPDTARVSVPGLSASFHFESTLASIDPTERLPAPVQWLVTARTKPRLSWLRVPFELRLGGRVVSGEAIAKLSYSNPLPARVAEPRRESR